MMTTKHRFTGSFADKPSSCLPRYLLSPLLGLSFLPPTYILKNKMGDPRCQLIPINRRYPLSQLSTTLRKYFPLQPNRSREPLMGVLSTEQTATQSAEGVASQVLSDHHQEASQGYPTAVATAVDQYWPTRSLVESQSPQQPARERCALPAEMRSVRPGVRRAKKNPILAVEYTLLGGVNDSTEDAERLASWLEGILCVVNLITFNPHEGTPFSPASPVASKAFREVLVARGQLCTYRNSRGDDGMAACG